MSEESKTYGQIAYEAHAEILGRVDPGATLPAWDDLDAGAYCAWMAAGRAVDEQVRTDGIAVPPPAGRDALEQLAAHWETAAGKIRAVRPGHARSPSEQIEDYAHAARLDLCASQLREAIGAKP